MSEAAGHALQIRGLTKRYGDFTAVDSVSLDIERGEFLTLLGPSGSGKTTILMAVAGFVLPKRRNSPAQPRFTRCLCGSLPI